MENLEIITPLAEGATSDCSIISIKHTTQLIYMKFILSQLYAILFMYHNVHQQSEQRQGPGKALSGKSIIFLE